MRRVLFVVPARGGSQGLAGKNLRELAGIPLVGWAVRNALRAARLTPGRHTVVCSTDDPRIAAAARDWGAATPFERPPDLATATASSVDVALHALDRLGGEAEFDAVCLVQPTTPLAVGEDVASAVELFFAGDGSPVVTATPTHPAGWVLELDGARVVSDAVGGDRRQEHRPAVTPNGAAFVAGPARLRRTRRFLEPGLSRVHVMPAGRGVDVDDAHDLAVCAALLASRPVPPLELAGRRVGPEHDRIVVVEVVDEDGDAGDVCREAAAAGADAVLLPARAVGAAPAASGVAILARPEGPDDAGRVAGLGVAGLDVSGGGRLPERGHQACPLLVAGSGRPFAETAAELTWLEDGGDPPVALVAEASDGLDAVARLRQAFGRQVAVRTGGDEALAAAAIAAGAGLVLARRGRANLAELVDAVRRAAHACAAQEPSTR